MESEGEAVETSLTSDKLQVGWIMVVDVRRCPAAGGR